MDPRVEYSFRVFICNILYIVYAIPVINIKLLSIYLVGVCSEKRCRTEAESNLGE